MKEKLLAYIKQFKIMPLATYGENPWLCWVFFLIDDDFNIYFISGDSQHVKDILKDNRVSCGFADTTQDPTGKKKGVQVWGTAETVHGVDQIQWFFKMWKEILIKEEKKYIYENYVNKVFSSKVYKITPKKIKWFNDEIENREFVLEFE